MRSPALTAASLTLLLALVGCGSSGEIDSPAADGDDVAMPSSSADFEEQQYEEVVESLTEAGYTNVTATALGDLVTGWLKDPGEVKSVTVGDVDEFDDGEAFGRDAEVVVSYHSFPDEGGDNSEDVLTIENSEDLAALLSGPASGPTVEAFTAKYGEGNTTISFDAHVTYLLASERYTYSSAYLVAGDSGSTAGPVFEFTPLLIPESSPLQQADLREGQNVRITAQVGYFRHHDASALTEEVNRVVLVPLTLVQR